VDNALLGNQEKLPDTLKTNKAHNTLFALPLALGILGLLYQYRKDRQGNYVSLLLFIFTGLAIVFYLNQAGNQPRERDYAYVGSFYAFAIWIGLGVMQVREWLQRFLGERPANLAAGLLCLLAVPTLMAAQEWDDHDRSRKTLARDLAKNYLESCAPNAILFSFGDNDTYPLWYAQEVEGIRRDVRVINYSLLGIDWYINQLRYKVNQSDPIDVIWSADKIEGNKRDFVRYYETPGVSEQSRYVDLYSLMSDFIGSDDPDKQLPLQDGTTTNYLPVKKVSVAVDTVLVRRNGTVNPGDPVLPEIRFELPRNILLKNDMAVLNIIAGNKWRRPIYFTSPFGELGFAQYLRNDGMSYRLVPLQGQNMVNDGWAFEKLKKDFVFGGSDRKDVYFDEENRRHLLGIRQSYVEVAGSLVNNGRLDDARLLLRRLDSNMHADNVPYGLASRQNQHDMISIQMADLAYRSGDKALGDKITDAVGKDLAQQVGYYANLGDMSGEQMLGAVQEVLAGQGDNLSNRQRGLFIEIRQALALQEYLKGIKSQYGAAAAPPPASGAGDTTAR
jgi:hypothetical protein